MKFGIRGLVVTIAVCGGIFGVACQGQRASEGDMASFEMFSGENYCLQTNISKSLTEVEVAAVRFYFHCVEIDPNVDLLLEAYLYLTEKIPIQSFRTDFINLMNKHTGIQIEEMWFEEEKLYIDLYVTESSAFNLGNTGSTDRGNRLILTLASIPSVSYFEVLLDGVRGYQTSHFNFGWIAAIENGRIMGFYDFDGIPTYSPIRYEFWDFDGNMD